MERLRSDWPATTFTLCVVWLAVSAALVVLNFAMPVSLPGFVAKPAPFLIAGLVAGRRTGASSLLSSLAAAALLVVVSSAGWTLFSFATGPLPAARLPLLFALSLPVNALGGLWATGGLVAGGRSTGGDAELDDLERELRDEAPRPPGAGS